MLMLFPKLNGEDDETIATLEEDTIRAIIDIGSTGDRTILEYYSGSIQIPGMSPTLYIREPPEKRWLQCIVRWGCKP